MGHAGPHRVNLDEATDVAWTTGFQEGRHVPHDPKAPWWGLHVGE